MFPSVNPGMGMSRLVRAGDMRRDAGLAAQMQPVYVGSDLRDRTVMLGKIVNEDSAARRIFIKDSLKRRSFWPLIGEHPQIDTVIGELARAIFRPMVLKIGQHHDIGIFSKRGD